MISLYFGLPGSGRTSFFIKYFRKSVGMTRSKFASYLNVSKRLVKDWEKGIKSPPPDLIRLLEYKLQEFQK